MASTNARARALWQLRERLIRAALAKLADEHGVPNKFRADEVADVINGMSEIPPLPWTPAQRYELSFFIRQAGRRLFPEGGPCRDNVVYCRGWFIVPGQQSDAFGIHLEASNADASVEARRDDAREVVGGKRTVFVPTTLSVGEGGR